MMASRAPLTRPPAPACSQGDDVDFERPSDGSELHCLGLTFVFSNVLYKED